MSIGEPKFCNHGVTGGIFSFKESHVMTLLDYLAAKVIQGLCANPNWVSDIDDSVKRAYEIANAMLKAREEEKGS